MIMYGFSAESRELHRLSSRVDGQPSPRASFADLRLAMTFALSFFRVVAACTSTMMILSPIPSIYKVLKRKHTGVGSIVPLVSMFANCHIAMMFGYLSELWFPVFSTFVFGDLICAIYIAIFYRFSHEKSKAHKVFALFGIPVALVTVFAFLAGYGVTHQTRYNAGQTVGYVGIVATVILYSSPFEKIGLVLKHRSAVFINIHMVCAGTFNNSMWITYGYLTREWVIFAPNVFCCTMGCIQILLFVIFHPSTHPYDGPIPGVTQDDPLSVDVEMGGLTVSPSAKSRIDSPAFVPLASPLEPLHTK